MTDKKERILNSALELFANESYDAVSTSKIAKQAEVSEGLIFRHFINKQGLLKAIMEEAEQKIKVLLTDILFENDPKSVLRKTIELPFKADESQYNYWKLQFKLKWDQQYNNPDKMKIFIDKLTSTFTELGYESPELEARYLQQMLDSISIEVIRGNMDTQKPFESFLKNKYNL